LLEGLAFGEGEGVGFGNDGDDIDYIGQFLEDHDVNGFETRYQAIFMGQLRVTRGLDEEETTVDTSVLDVSITLSGEFFP
jgi:hypothetical protein